MTRFIVQIFVFVFAICRYQQYPYGTGVPVNCSPENIYGLTDVGEVGTPITVSLLVPDSENLRSLAHRKPSVAMRISKASFLWVCPNVNEKCCVWRGESQPMCGIGIYIGRNRPCRAERLPSM